MRAILKPIVDLIGPSYVAMTNKKLAAYGLRYDDLYDPLKDEVGLSVACSNTLPARLL